MTSRRRFLVGVGTAATAGGLAGCGYRPGGGDIRWRADGDFATFPTRALDVTDGLVVTVADSTTSFDIEREEWIHGGEVTAYSTADGSRVWSDRLDGELSCHTVGDGGAAVGFDGTVVRYAAGGRQWGVDLGASLLALAVADGDRTYALTDTGDLVACAGGAERWRVDLEPELGADDGGFEPAVAASHETVVCWVGGSTLAFDTGGRRRWSQPDINVRRFSFVDGAVFASGGGGVATFDGATGDLRWITDDGGGFTVTADAVYSAYDTKLRAYDHSGSLRWSIPDDTGPDRDRAVRDPAQYQGPVAADSEGVYVDSSGGLTALDPGDGSVRWRMQNRMISAGPYLADSGVLVVAENELVCHYREADI